MVGGLSRGFVSRGLLSMVPVRTGAVWVSVGAGLGAGAAATTGGAARTTGAGLCEPDPVRLTTGAGAFVLQALSKNIKAKADTTIDGIKKGDFFKFIEFIPKLSRTFG
jgi:hypothetical protein